MLEGLVRLGFDGGRGDDTECIGAFYQEAAAAFNIRGSSSKKGVRIWAEAGWQQARHAPIRGEVRRLRWDGQGWCVASAGRRQPRADRVDNGRWPVLRCVGCGGECSAVQLGLCRPRRGGAARQMRFWDQAHIQSKHRGEHKKAGPVYWRHRFGGSIPHTGKLRHARLGARGREPWRLGV